MLDLLSLGAAVAQPTVLAGIALVRLGQVLLVHPTGAGPEGTWSLPKGHQEPGEPTVDAAIREFSEEVGIRVPRAMLSGVPRRVWKNKKKVMLYWVVDAEHLNLPDELPKDQLQQEEVDRAMFVDLFDADFLIEDWQVPVLASVPTSEHDREIDLLGDF